jgi:PPOX class probable F420-dependent enzyme
MERFDDLADARYVSLVTYRRSGEAVATPVWFVVREGRGHVYTGEAAGKLKRIRHDPRVRVAACSFRGKLKGPYHAGTAGVLDEAGAAQAREAFAAKYGVQWRFVIRRNERRGGRSVFVEVVPT